MTSFRRVEIALISSALVSALILTACSGGGGASAEPAASAMAKALQSGDFTDVPLAEESTGDEAAVLSELLGDLSETARTVKVADIEKKAGDDDDDTRVATYELTWDVDDSGTAGDSEDDWTYTTSAQLVLLDDEWLAEFAPSVVHPDLTSGSSLTVRRTTAKRGPILGGNGEPIVENRVVNRLGIDKANVERGLEEAAGNLAELVGVDEERFVDKVTAAGDKAFVEAIVLREADAADLLKGVDDIDGGRVLEDTMPLAPSREFARQILGTVGEATAEIVDESAGKVAPGDEVGLSGIQLQYDEQLRGRPGTEIEIIHDDGEGQVVYELPAVPGEPLTTTLDADLQERADALLADVEPASAIVAVQPSTGAVLAAASGAGGEGLATATVGQYAPGSTFKVITALALLRSGMTPDSTLSCSTEIDVDGKKFKNFSGYPADGIGDIPLSSVIANSCNTALIAERDTVTQVDLADAAAALGLGQGHDAGVVAFLGDVPAEGEGTTHAASMIGQADVLASPLAMATVAASVATGHTVVPHLVGEPREPGDGLAEDEAQTLRDFMFGVVDGGTASFLAGVPGDPVGAKTGTAEFGTDDPPRTHAWMIAFQGDLAVAVFVEEGESGSQTAGPLLEEFLTR